MESGSTTRGECVLSDVLSPVPTSRPQRSLSLPGTSSTLSPRSAKGSGVVAKEKGKRPSLKSLPRLLPTLDIEKSVPGGYEPVSLPAGKYRSPKKSSRLPLKPTMYSMKSFTSEFTDPLLERNYIISHQKTREANVRMWAIVNSVLHVAAAIFEHVLLVSEDIQFKDAESCNRMSYYLYAPPIGHGIIALVMVVLAVFPKVSMRLIATLHGVRGLMLLAITVVIQLHQSTCYNDEELTAELTEDQWLVKCYSVLYVTSVYFSSGLTLKWSFPISTAFIITVNVLSLFNTFTNMEVSDMLYVLLQIALVLLFNFKCAYVGYWNERRRRLGYVTRNSIIKERKRNNDLLYEMIPESIVPKLLMNARNAEKGGGAVCEIYENTTVMFVYVANYSTLVKTTEPFELVRLLNTLYSKLDGIIEGSDVTKMDAVGGVYIGVAGCPTPCERHSEAIAEAALNIMELADSGALGIDLKIGIHSGPVASGVLGTYSRKWSIFSDTVNTASRMASTASVKSIQLTETVRSALEKSSEFQLKYRGKQSVKGKGEMDTYLLQNFKFPMRRSISFSAEEETKGLVNKPHADLNQKEIDGLFNGINKDAQPASSVIWGTRFLNKVYEKKYRSDVNRDVKTKYFVLSRLIMLAVPMFLSTVTLESTRDRAFDDYLGMTILATILLLYMANLYLIASPWFDTLSLAQSDIVSGIAPIAILCSGFISACSYILNISLVDFHLILVVLVTSGFRLRYCTAMFSAALIFSQAIAMRFIIDNGTANSDFMSSLVADVCIFLSTWFCVGMHCFYLEATEHLELSHRMALESEHQCFRTCLDTLFPSDVFTDRILDGEHIIQELPDVTFLYSDLVGYTAMSSQLSPLEVMTLLNRLYCRFEKHLSQRGVYKLDTIGDAFIVIGGLGKNESKTFNHCDSIVLFAIDMLRELEDFKESLRSEEGGIHPAVANLQIRIGVHTGKGIAGVVGSRRPRLLVWGMDAVRAEHMESTGTPGAIHLSETAEGRMSMDVKRKLHFESRSCSDLHSYFKESQVTTSRLHRVTSRKYSLPLSTPTPTPVDATPQGEEEGDEAANSGSPKSEMKTYIVHALSRKSKRYKPKGLLGLGKAVGSPTADLVYDEPMWAEKEDEVAEVILGHKKRRRRNSVVIEPLIHGNSSNNADTAGEDISDIVLPIPLLSIFVRKGSVETPRSNIDSNEASPFSRMGLISPTLSSSRRMLEETLSENPSPSTAYADSPLLLRALSRMNSASASPTSGASSQPPSPTMMVMTIPPLPSDSNTHNISRQRSSPLACNVVPSPKEGDGHSFDTKKDASLSDLMFQLSPRSRKALGMIPNTFALSGSECTNQGGDEEREKLL